jgi:hypothetical protein
LPVTDAGMKKLRVVLGVEGKRFYCGTIVGLRR